MDEKSSTLTVAVDTLRGFLADIFAAAGCERAEADRIAHYLIAANLAGHDSHGAVRTPAYVQWLHEGRVKAGQTITIVHETPIQATVDGHFGFGQTVVPQAVDLGVAKAKANGMSIIALRRSGHAGRIGDWAERAAAAGLISIHFVNVPGGLMVAPFGGVDRRFSTNPFTIGVPAEEGRPTLLMDFATSLVAEGKIQIASRGGKPVPEGSMIHPNGQLTNDPSTLYGPLIPGGPRDGSKGDGAMVTFGLHKGSGIAFMCEILAGVLGGAATSGPVPPGSMLLSNSLLSIYIDPVQFGAADFTERVREFVAYVKSSRPSTPGGEVLVPGEQEDRTRAERLANGIPLQADTWAAIVNTAKSHGVEPPK
jgi:uncharacterized oxidoreductase